MKFINYFPRLAKCTLDLCVMFYKPYFYIFRMEETNFWDYGNWGS